ESRALVQAHRRRGHTLAVVSSATRYQIEPIARELGIPNVLCTRLEVQNGRLTGRHLWPTVYGGGKAMAARELARAQGIDLAQSYFYTDSHEDLPLLEIVGRPRPTNPNRRLAAVAAVRGWPARRFTTRGTPGLTDVVRSSLALASIVPSFALGAVPGRAFTARSDRQRASAALRRAIAALKAGTSLVIAPEGTRSPTPRLGPFKKGAFHMAMGAGVPIVPIVFRNSLDALPKHGLV